MRKLFLMVLLIIGLVSAGFAQPVPNNLRQLGEAISSGDLTLTAKGTDGSSGAVVYGSLWNNTPNTIYANINLIDGLYLVNSGSGQNMIATQVVLSTGEYNIGSNGMYISIAPNKRTPIMFLAFCADFFKKNPKETENFTNASIPAKLKKISSSISRYMANHIDDDVIVPVQLAVWRNQGLTKEIISLQFDFTSSDWDASTSIMNY